MVICSRCEQPVDETTRTTCPLCFTPLPVPGNAAQPTAPPAPAPQAPGMMPGQNYAPQAGGVPPLAPPNAMPPGAAPLNAAPNAMPAIRPMPTAAPMSAPVAAPRMEANQRMTLTGEIIEAPQPMSSAPAAGNSQYQARTSASAPRQPEKVERARPNIGLIVLVIALLGGGGGGWYFWMHRTNPKDQAQKFLDAIKIMDTKALYQTTENDSKSEDDFVKEKEASPQYALGKTFVTALLSGIQFKAGQPKYNGMNEATVPVTMSGSASLFPGQKGQEISKTIDLPMKNFNGIWKVSKDSSLAGGAGGMMGKMGSIGGAK